MWMYWSNKHAWINKDFSISYLFMKEVHYFWMNPILTVEDIVYTDWWWQHHVLTPGAGDPESGANKCHRILHEYQDSLWPVVYKSVPGALCPQFWVQNTGTMMLPTLLVCAVGVSLTTGRMWYFQTFWDCFTFHINVYNYTTPIRPTHIIICS